MDKEFYYQKQVSQYAKINNFNFNQYNNKIITKNLKVFNLLETNSGNGIVQLYSPFVQRSTTVSKNPTSGSIIVYGGASLINGNINVLGEKNPINFFQSSLKANSLISFEGIQINKDLLTYTLETQSNSSIVDVQGNINNNNVLITDLAKLISLSDVYIGNELKGTNLHTAHNITIPNIINPTIVFTKNTTNFNTINANTINSYFIDANTINTNKLYIENLDNLYGNIDGVYVNIELIKEYENINTNLLIVEENLSELINIPNANVTTSTTISGILESNIVETKYVTVTNFANVTNLATAGNIIFTKVLLVDELNLFDLFITDIAQHSTIKKIYHTGNVIINSKFNVSGNVFFGNVQNISYYDNMIPINLNDNNLLKDSGYQYNYLDGNVGVIYRKQFYDDSIIGNVNNTFIIGKFNYQDPMFPIINLLDVYANAVYGDISTNTISLGITNNVFIGNTNLITTLYGNIYSNNAFISNLSVNNIIANTLITNKNITGNILFSDYLEGNVLIPNIHSNSITYSNLTSTFTSSNILNLDGNITINNLQILNLNANLNNLTSQNLTINNQLTSNSIISNNLIANNILSNINNTTRVTVLGNVTFGNIYTSVNYINSNTQFDDYDIAVINNKNISANLYVPPIGDIQIFDQYYRKSNNTRLQNNVNNILLSTNNPIIKTIYNNKFLVMKNKNRSYHFNPNNNIQNIQLNEQINSITSSYNGEVLGIDTIGNNYIYCLNNSTKQYNLTTIIPKSSSLSNTKTIDFNIDGNIAIVGDPMFDNQSGIIMIYTFDGIQYNLSNSISGSSNSRLGYNVGIVNNKIVGSAPDNGTYGSGGNKNGNVYIYNNNLTIQNVINYINPGKEFGRNISLTNKNLAIADTNNVYSFNDNTLIGNTIINGSINSIHIDDSNNFITLNGNLNNATYKLRTNIITFTSNYSLNNSGQSIITGDGSYLYNIYNGYLTKHINCNGNFMLEHTSDTGIRGNNIFNVTKNGNFLYIGNNNGNVYVYN